MLLSPFEPKDKQFFLEKFLREMGGLVCTLSTVHLMDLLLGALPHCWHAATLPFAKIGPRSNHRAEVHTEGFGSDSTGIKGSTVAPCPNATHLTSANWGAVASHNNTPMPSGWLTQLASISC